MVSFTRLAIISFCHQNHHIIPTRRQFHHRLTSHASSSSTFAFFLSSFTAAIATGGNNNQPPSLSSSPLTRSATTLTPSTSRTITTHCSASLDDTMFSSTSGDNDANDVGTPFETGYLNAKDAYDLDQQLFSTGYTLEQLMELAGLAVAEAVHDVSPPTEKPISATGGGKKRVLIVCGPGNNGGDGLVAARHLVMFGYDATVVYPKRSQREVHYSKLVKQCEDVGVEVLDNLPQGDDDSGNTNNHEYDVIIDAIFGFSFKGEAREPFGTIINKMIDMQQSKKIPIIAVDVPSGWNVDEGDVANTGMVPDVLVSLTAPKLCSKEFRGRHFVGGRFLPPNIAEKYGIRMPPYPGVRQVMELRNSAAQAKDDSDSWAEEYAAYCAEKEAKEFTFDKIESAETESEGKTDDEDWALQYQNYCIEKEAKLAEKEKADAKKKESGGVDDDENWMNDYAEYLKEKEKETQSEGN